jgi:hypothetical protein
MSRFIEGEKKGAEKDWMKQRLSIFQNFKISIHGFKKTNKVQSVTQSDIAQSQSGKNLERTRSQIGSGLTFQLCHQKSM